MKATAKDLRFHSREILDAVARGEEVIITYRGVPRAKIIPYELNEDNRIKETSLFGMWQDRDDMKNVTEYVRSLRRGRNS